MRRISVLTAVVGLTLSACATDDPDAQAKTGALVGSLAGAAASHQLEDDDKAELIGAAAGALAGAMVGSYMDKQQQELEQSLLEEQRKRQVEIERLEDDTLKLYLQNEVFFDFDSAVIKDPAEPILHKVAKHLIQYTQTAVHVIGHTDSVGAREYNLHLSERRASSVATQLNRQGVTATRIRIEGRGENEPRDSATTEAAKHRNRRVEIFVRPIVEGKEDLAYESPRY
ncbi:MAG: OmpA family protein [Gammaproteobacteria bacterium]|nr:OmpA family protein [Gammaproteobacteria bacterium]